MGDTAKLDRRVVKTKRAIRNAFAELLSTKDINEITVKDIADLADINRKTFYCYYAGVFQVVDEIENEIVQAFMDAIRDIDLNRALHEPYEIFKRLTAIFNSDIDFYGSLMRMEHNTGLIPKIADSIKYIVMSFYGNQINLDEAKKEVIVNYTISGLLAVYQQWFNSDRKQPIEELSKDLGNLIFRGIQGVLDSNNMG